MNPKICIPFGILIVLTLSGCTVPILRPIVLPDNGAHLPVCGKKGSTFEYNDFASYDKDTGWSYEWNEIYNQTISRALDDHTRAIKEQEINCLTEDPLDMLPSQGANQLASAAGIQRNVREMDFAQLVAEFTTKYQCSLLEEETFLPLRVSQDAEKNNVDLNYVSLLQEANQRKAFIDQEISRTNTITERIALLTGGLDRLKPLTNEMVCLARTTLDLQNELSLISEVNACLPRASEGKTSLLTTEKPPKK